MRNRLHHLRRQQRMTHWYVVEIRNRYAWPTTINFHIISHVAKPCNRFCRGNRRCSDNRNASLLRTFTSNTCGIPRWRSLVNQRFIMFVDHHNCAQPRARRKHRGPRTNNHIDAAQCIVPLVGDYSSRKTLTSQCSGTHACHTLCRTHHQHRSTHCQRIHNVERRLRGRNCQ
ncbi:unannotated protein [freshwater metagenome]|uniref:Unannotated protein n=1 Tax=freshwater metagenome TaxID=449393 RepID=A0A6J6HCZ6_9ZZZZ